MTDALFSSVDCIQLPVDDLEAALEFYRDKLGHRLVWRTDTGAGLAFGDGATEIVLGKIGNETDIKVESAVEAADRFREAGGTVVREPFDIAIGKCVVVRDPWGNQLVLLDTSKGLLRTDEDGYVIGEGERDG